MRVLERSRSSAAITGMFLAALLFSGCGDGSGTVKGTVTGVDGQPLKGGQVEIHTAGGVRIGQINEDGSYVVYAVPPGAAKVSVRPGMPPGAPASGAPLEPGQTPEKIDPRMLAEINKLKRAVPDQYQRLESTPIELDVKGGPNDFPIQLKP